MRDDTRRVASIIEEMTEEARHMLALLNREASLIKSRNVEAIETITGEKQLSASKLEEFSLEIHTMFSSAGQSLITVKALDQPGQEHRTFSPDLDKQWSNANTLLQQCKKLNDSNGAGLELLARHCKRCLDFLRNQSNSDQTYGPDGVEKNLSSSRSLTLA